MEALLTWGLYAVAIGQILIAGINLRLEQVMGWAEELNRTDLLMRQVFRIHGWFISLTLLIFGVITAANADTMVAGTETTAVWLAGGIAGFWAIRFVLQFTYYAPEHWKGKRLETFLHIVLALTYLAFTATYATALVLALT
jgi:hypothetical protein